jgi:hypothetical protein
LELARSPEKLGHLYGKKHEPTSDFPHCDLIVLEYADFEESSRYKFLDARREKEKAASNQTTRESVKANTVVFPSLALLYNLCSSAKLDWEVCGSADGTHGLLSKDYKVIGFGVYHVAPDGVKRWLMPLQLVNWNFHCCFYTTSSALPWFCLVLHLSSKLVSSVITPRYL